MALEVRTRKCVERASSRPPPRAREEMAEMVGMGRSASEVKVALRLVRNSAVLREQLYQHAHILRKANGFENSSTYSCGVKPRRSLRSAPAQKQVSTALARTMARVGPSCAPALCLPTSSFPEAASYWAWTSSTSARREASRALEMALRAEGRLSSRTRMWPEPAAGRLVTRMSGSVEEEAEE